MSAELVDFRLKVTPETARILTAIANARGIDVSELVRDILNDWARERTREATAVLAELGEDVAPAIEEAKRNCRVAISEKDRRAIYARDGGVCSYCRVILDLDGAWHIDHVTPVKRGGTNDPSNLVLACVPCNLKKAAGTVVDFKVA